MRGIQTGVSILFSTGKRSLATHCLLVFLYFAHFTNSVAQDNAADTLRVHVTSGFIEDSLKIGEPGRFYLTARYPKALDVIFPDSSFAYAPFEFTGKYYAPTETSDGISYDSVIYSLSTFEIDRTQYLSLPVFKLNPQD